MDRDILGSLTDCNVDENETIVMWFTGYISSEDFEKLLKLPERERFYEAVKIKAELY